MANEKGQDAKSPPLQNQFSFVFHCRITKNYLNAARLLFLLFTITHNEEDYVHPAHCGMNSCRKAIQLMREKHFLNAIQRAGEHRRVLGSVICFLLFISKFIQQ